MNADRPVSSHEVTLHGHGSLGGKGAGLVRINDCDLPAANKLPTHILATGFYDRYVEEGQVVGSELLGVPAAILAELLRDA